MKPIDIPYRRLHLFGASGSGATTLGRALGERLPHTVLDGDGLQARELQRYGEDALPGGRLYAQSGTARARDGGSGLPDSAARR
ncbi:hypothetical protein [Saccharibacillus deserti]|uniref:hypothetical protein n=1 Tax=Saccharibacillus deserti TaxID=1634444 RepID=UPI003CCCEC97